MGILQHWPLFQILRMSLLSHRSIFSPVFLPFSPAALSLAPSVCFKLPIVFYLSPSISLFLPLLPSGRLFPLFSSGSPPGPRCNSNSSATLRLRRSPPGPLCNSNTSGSPPLTPLCNSNIRKRIQQKEFPERQRYVRNGVMFSSETELKEKKLRVEDALNATKAAVEEGIVVGDGCALLRLAAKVDAIKETLYNDEQKVGADIVKRALSYPLKLIAKNAGVNGSVVTEKVLSSDNFKFGYNAATGQYEDLMAAGIIDPTKLVRCCLEHAASVAKTFLTSDVVVVDIKEPEPIPAGNPMDNSGYGY